VWGTHLSKCKNDKIKERKERKIKKKFDGVRRYGL
jgi:hypothetical protein